MSWLALALAAAGAVRAQTSAGLRGALQPDWRRIGSPSYEMGLASPATGPVQALWFSPDGRRLIIRTESGRYWESEDLERWRPLPGFTPPDLGPGLARTVVTLPEAEAVVRAGDPFLVKLYAFGAQLYASEDGGRRWRNLTGFRDRSIIGGDFRDLAISPVDPEVVAVANQRGVWRSADGGLSWRGLNDALPNLPVRRLLATPSGINGTRILLAGGDLLEWAPGEKQAWQPAADEHFGREEDARERTALQLEATITALSLNRDYSYAGSEDGRIWLSSDQGGSWHLSGPAGGAPVAAIYALPDDPRIVSAAFGGVQKEGAAGRVLRSTNGGITWEDLTGDLPPGEVLGLAADRTGTALYLATSAGVFVRMLDAGSPGLGSVWMGLAENLPSAPAVDVRLDDSGSQLYVALDGYGVYAAPAPHRFLRVEVVSAADFSRRAAAPGSLLTVLGDRLIRAQAGLIEAPVLHASQTQSQIQVPFEVSGDSALLALELARGVVTIRLPLQEASPAIFVGPDGGALLLEGTSGVLLDPLHPARSAARVQVLATGLGRVQPDWPTGQAAPVNGPPIVVASVRAYLDRAPIEVVRATLAPGYVGFYLVEVQLPLLVNGGPGELYLEVGGRESNRVRIDLEP
ncbi:MAG TPA: hypothetical protein VLH09_11880 [Bryobacteraceae bacterium]|nr:hypothetical protein [Bryobacteraceae bacterium]